MKMGAATKTARLYKQNPEMVIDFSRLEVATKMSPEEQAEILCGIINFALYDREPAADDVVGMIIKSVTDGMEKKNESYLVKVQQNKENQNQRWIATKNRTIDQLIMNGLSTEADREYLLKKSPSELAAMLPSNNTK